MDQQFLGVDAQMDASLGLGRLVPAMGSLAAKDSFDLSNPSNPAVATARAHMDPRSQRPPLQSQQLQPQHPQQHHQLHPHQQSPSQMPHVSQQPMPRGLMMPSNQMQFYPNHLMMPRGFDMHASPAAPHDKVKAELVAPIPPLHIQQQLVNDEKPEHKHNGPATPHLLHHVSPQPPPLPTAQPPPPQKLSPAAEVDPSSMLRTPCSRCKKDFDQPIIIPQASVPDQGGSKPLAEPKIFKLCQHCRDLQRQRSRRWQKKTKDKTGACRRCGATIPSDQQKFVLCPGCRKNLRTRKANRAAQGKCVHCSGPLDASIITGDDAAASAKFRLGSYKVCQRCRENDKIRRKNLEKMGNCNRCAKQLEPSELGKHKVCSSCRNRKKKLTNGVMIAPSPDEQGQGNALLGVGGDPLMNPYGSYAPQQQQQQSQPLLQQQQQQQQQQYVPQSQSQAQTQAQAQAQAHAQAQVQAQMQAQYNQVYAQQQQFHQAMAQAQAQQKFQQQQQQTQANNRAVEEMQNAIVAAQNHNI
ncbi:hypothetical protein ABC855_g621 [[Candida] zeylanoides]